MTSADPRRKSHDPYPVAAFFFLALMRHASITTTMAFYVEQDAEDIANRIWQAENGASDAGSTSHMASHKPATAGSSNKKKATTAE